MDEVSRLFCRLSHEENRVKDLVDEGYLDDAIEAMKEYINKAIELLLYLKVLELKKKGGGE